MYQTAPDFPAAESVLYNSPLGILILEADEAGLTAVRFSPEQAPDTAVRPGPITTRAAEWLDGYFSGSCPEPDFPLNLKGTPFQKEVWAILQTIPAGKTMTYGEIARILADRRGIDRMAAQAVGQAVGKNPVCILVPCHRVLGQCQRLTGYAGGLECKKALLTLEGAEFLPDSK